MFAYITKIFPFAGIILKQFLEFSFTLVEGSLSLRLQRMPDYNVMHCKIIISQHLIF